MLPEEDRIRLQHMLDAARKAVRLAAKGDRSTLDDEDDALGDALVRLVSLIGEAANKVSPATCALPALGGIPWADVVGMRNRLIHGYFDINLDILWATVQSSLPAHPRVGISPEERRDSPAPRLAWRRDLSGRAARPGPVGTGPGLAGVSRP